MMGEEWELVCVQKYPELIDQCIDLINSEWPRTKTARLVSIQQGSPDGFPTSLVLIDKKNKGQGVVGHCKVSPVSIYNTGACFIESVVIAKDLRGKGLGRILMGMVEEYVKCRGIHTIYLTTLDQQGFYMKLGYSLCDPIMVSGGKIRNVPSSSSVPNKPLAAPSSQSSSPMPKKEETVVPNTSPPPPPPPPPLPKPCISNNSNNNNNNNLDKGGKSPSLNIVMLPSTLKLTMKKSFI